MPDDGGAADRRGGRRARPDRAEYDLIVEKMGREPNAGRARDVLADVERALLLQALQEAARARCRPRARTCSSWARARTPAPSTSATAWRSPSRSSRTTTRARSSRSRARPPASAASCATSSPSARGPIAVLDSLRFGELARASARATCSTAPSPASATTATRSACRRSAARSTSRVRTSRTASSTRWRSAWPTGDQLIRSAAAGVGNHRRALRRLDRPRRHRRRVGAGQRRARRGRRRTSARPCRSATRSRSRKLVECSLELLERGLLVSLQDLGAAGLTSSASARWRARARSASTSHVDRVPLREPGMEPFEIMVSESQERMLCVVEPERVDEVLAVCEKWEVHDTVDRRGHRHRRTCGSTTAASSSATCRSPALVDDCPVYDLEPAQPGRAALPRAAPRRSRPASRHARRRCSRCSRSPNIASRRPLLRAVRLRSCSRAPSAARSRPTPPCSRCRGGARRIAVSHRRHRPPRRRRSVPRHDRRRARVRGEPRLRRRRAARPDELPELRQPREAAHRLAADRVGHAASATPAARSTLPVVGGNVSLYNEGADGPIYPTPVVGIVGELPDAERRRPARASRRRATPSRSSAPFAPSLAGERAGQAARRGAARRAAAGGHRRA